MRWKRRSCRARRAGIRKAGASTALQAAVGDGLDKGDLGGLATMFKDELLLVSKSLSCCLRSVKEGATAVVKDEHLPVKDWRNYGI